MSSVTQATGWYFRFTWDIAPCVALHVCPHGPSAGISWFMVLVLLFPRCIVSVNGIVEGEKGFSIEKSLCDSGGCLSVVGSFLHVAIDHVRVEDVPLDPFLLEARGEFGSVKRMVKFGLGACS